VLVEREQLPLQSVEAGATLHLTLLQQLVVAVAVQAVVLLQ